MGVRKIMENAFWFTQKLNIKYLLIIARQLSFQNTIVFLSLLFLAFLPL